MPTDRSKHNNSDVMTPLIALKQEWKESFDLVEEKKEQDEAAKDEKEQ